ncbi:MAG: glycosyltransferase family 9 protein [Prolixibacteraceae bacterium]|nr:glycosyltransferase family 9 protein [Prolixibacteraceae bacterium]
MNQEQKNSVNVRFLVIRFSSIGDIVLTTPVVRLMKQQIDGAEIHFVCKEKYEPVLRANPYIDKLHMLDSSLPELIKKLQSEDFDHIIDLSNNIRSWQIKRKLHPNAFSLKKLNIKKWLLVNFKINLMPNKHVVDRYIEAASLFDICNDNRGLDHFVPHDEECPVESLPEGFRQGYIAFVIGGTYATKRLPPHKIAEICKAIDIPVILIGHKKEFDHGETIVSNAPARILNLAGKTTINQSALLVKNARLVLTNDTGLMHIAAAYHKPILSFWGNTVPAFGMTPYMPHPASLILETPNVKCRPCSKLGFDKCPKKHFRCMNEINTSIAISWINENFDKQ